jgi:DUF1009 family protein
VQTTSASGLDSVNKRNIAVMEKRVAIIAGNGSLPVEIASELEKFGNKVYILGIAGEAEPVIENFDHDYIHWGQVSRMFKLLRSRKVSDVTLAGGISRRPAIREMKLDIGAILSLPRVLGWILSGDNAVLVGVIEGFKKKGFVVRGAHELVPELLVKAGANTKKKPSDTDLERIELGFSVARALGQFDVGQAVVVIENRVVALEGVEGTDAMLERVAALRAGGRLPKKKGGVLIKCAKPGQDLRADLPSIGPNSIEKIVEAGLSGIGVEAGLTLMISREETLKRANKSGVFIYGA